MTEDAKQAIDIVAASTALGTMVAWLPPLASLFTCVWMAIRIFESESIQKLLGNK
jgi:hypothetical protein|tara:strand:+ start:734 stop:898 length:165 start_codon:yes stop_codon:yes gene_type:complete